MRFLTPLAAALVVACSAGAQSEPEPTIRVIAPGDIVLQEGQSAEIELPGAPSVLLVTFTRIVSESRCPSNVQCVWAGEVSTLLTLGGAQTGALTLNLPGSNTKPATGTAGPYRIELKGVTPYPVSGSPRQEPNRVTLGISLQP